MQSFEILLSLFPLTTSFLASVSDIFKETIFISLLPVFFRPLSSYVAHGGMKRMIRSRDIISLSSNAALPSGYLFSLAYTYTTM